MAISATTIMSQQQEDENNNNNNKDKDDDPHEHDMIMPGFRFHPTEEELIEFYLRRKVEGKRFNVELITFLDLYRYDPWELPALAAIGEKEWFFYVPRDRKYRNGDRPNRVTTSGYWKATGADRMIRTENSRSIGLKKTLVFYSGKAPKGIRTSWIMNEYRLPQHETERQQKAEISLCRVYKRAGVEDHPSLPRSLPTRASSSSSSSSRAALKKTMNDPSNHEPPVERFSYNPHQILDKQVNDQTSGNTTNVATSLALSTHNPYISLAPIPLPPSDNSLEDNNHIILQHHHQSKQQPSSSSIECSNPTIFPTPSFVTSSNVIDDLHRLVNFQHGSTTHHQLYHDNNTNHPSHLAALQPQPQPQPHSQALSLNMLPDTLQAAFSDRLWDWTSVTDPSKEFHNPFK